MVRLTFTADIKVSKSEAMDASTPFIETSGAGVRGGGSECGGRPPPPPGSVLRCWGMVGCKQGWPAGLAAGLLAGCRAAELLAAALTAWLLFAGLTARLLAGGLAARLLAAGLAAWLLGAGLAAWLLTAGLAARLMAAGLAAWLLTAGLAAWLLGAGLAARLMAAGMIDRQSNAAAVAKRPKRSSFRSGRTNAAKHLVSNTHSRDTCLVPCAVRTGPAPSVGRTGACCWTGFHSRTAWSSTSRSGVDRHTLGGSMTRTALPRAGQHVACASLAMDALDAWLQVLCMFGRCRRCACQELCVHKGPELWALSVHTPQAVALSVHMPRAGGSLSCCYDS
eukprot:364210-Chlamydomonas_euryale.AAC.2